MRRILGVKLGLDEHRSVRGHSALDGAGELVSGRRAYGVDPERSRDSAVVDALERRAADVIAGLLLASLDLGQIVVDHDHEDDRQAEPSRGCEVPAVHEEPPSPMTLTTGILPGRASFAPMAVASP